MWFNQYPYINVNDLNLDYLLKAVKQLRYDLENFVNINTIKYADPIQWNITKQYEANTVVVDANDGTAYLSVRPVPTGVAITNTDYWTEIFTLNLLSQNQNITLRDDGANVLATFSSVAGDWLIWNNILYRVSQPINVNEAYVVGYNIDRYTVELFIKDYIAALEALIGDLNDLNTTDKDSVVDAINELVATIGALTDLNTTDNSSIVNAINELVADGINVYDVKKHGAAGDGVTDDTAVFQAAIASGLAVFVPKGIYRITQTLTCGSFTKIIGVGNYSLNKTNTGAGSVLLFDGIGASDNGLALGVGSQYVTLKGLTVTRTDTPSDGAGIYCPANSHVEITNCEVYDFFDGFHLGNVGIAFITDCFAHDNFHDGFHFENQTFSGALQWQTQRCLSQENNRHGFVIVGVANDANHVTLGMFEQIYTFNNGGWGFYVQGVANGGINGLRISNAFIGNDNKGGIYINSLGTFGGFISDTVIEACGRSNSGRGKLIPAQANSPGISLVESGGPYTVENCIIKACSGRGIATRADYATITGCIIESNDTDNANPVNVSQATGVVIISNNLIRGTTYADIVFTTNDEHILTNNRLIGTTASYRAIGGTSNMVIANNITI